MVFLCSQTHKITPLGGMQWALSVVIGTSSLASGVLIRLIPDVWLGMLRISVVYRLFRRFGRSSYEKRAARSAPTAGGKAAEGAESDGDFV